MHEYKNTIREIKKKEPGNKKNNTVEIIGVLTR